LPREFEENETQARQFALAGIWNRYVPN